MRADKLKKRRYKMWSWKTVQALYLEEQPESDPVDIETRSRSLAAQMNRHDDDVRYREWCYRCHEVPSGLGMSETDDMNRRCLDQTA